MFTGQDLVVFDSVLMQICFTPSEAHILEDVNKCIQSLQDKDPASLDRTAGQIRGRTQRVDEVVTAEMENYQKGPYTDAVTRAVKSMRQEGQASLEFVNIHEILGFFGNLWFNPQPAYNGRFTLSAY